MIIICRKTVWYIHFVFRRLPNAHRWLSISQIYHIHTRWLGALSYDLEDSVDDSDVCRLCYRTRNVIVSFLAFTLVYLLFLRYKCHSIIALSASFVFLKREILQLPESIIPRFFVCPRNRFLWRVFLWKDSPLGKTSFRARTRTRTRRGARWSWTAWAWYFPPLLLQTILVLVQRSTNDLQDGFQLVGSVL